jgi:opacity protein-like surface antigen
MKIKVIAVATALVGICAAGTADAQTRRSAPDQTYGYIFGEFTHLSATGSSLDGGGIGGGWHFTRHLGIQGGVDRFTKSAVDYTNSYVEAMLTYPVTDMFSIYGSLGGSYADASTNVSTPVGSVSVSKSSTGYRAGIGIEHWFTRNFGLRAGYYRQNAGGVADTMNVGIAFRF